jgi:hypothetical protein
MDFSLPELERKLVKLDEELHSILSTVREFAKKHENIEEELEDFRNLVERIGKNRTSDEDTTAMIRRMRDRNYDI